MTLLGAGVFWLLVYALATPKTTHATSSPEPVLDLDRVASPPTLGRAMTTTVFLPLVGRQMGATINAWRAEYYANPDLAGDPVYVAEEKRVDYDWGEGSPRAGMPADRFSIRWSGDWEFEVGNYTFFAFADDGMRLWLDGNLIIDAWQQGMDPHQATRTIATEGIHTLRLEYFEWTGGAAVSLGWRRTDIYPQWQGEYYDNPWVEAPKIDSRTDTGIQFDWGDGCPQDLLNCDSFSIGWTSRPVFEAGTHRIYIYADDGYQLYVQGTKVKEGGWTDGQDGGQQDVTYDLTVDITRFRDLRFNFHDRGSLAEARLLIQKRGYPDWKAEYYGNRTLSGDPVRVKDDEAVFYDWGFDKPIGALPYSDSFSVRWSGPRFFHAGCYRFGIFADDGVRLWVDGELLIPEWHDGRGTYHSPYTYLTSGYHDFKIEYYEHSGEAEIRFWWE